MSQIVLMVSLAIKLILSVRPVMVAVHYVQVPLKLLVHPAQASTTRKLDKLLVIPLAQTDSLLTL